MAEARQCDMIFMDVSPFIYLTNANGLELLLNYAKRVYIPDEGYFECAGRWFPPYKGNGEPPSFFLSN